MNSLISSDLAPLGPDIEPDYDEKSEVKDITPDESVEGEEAVPLATDHEAMKKNYLPDLPDLEIIDETINTWHIKGWSKLGKKEHGPTFQAGGFPWRVLFFPYGNNSDFASFYLEHAYEDKIPQGWSACVQFMLVLSNPNDPSLNVYHHATHRFTPEEGDWGFTKFFELRRLINGTLKHEGRPMIEDDAAVMTAYVRVVKDPTGVLWHSFVNYDSKKETGMVGLKNQGATCYLNSLLQSLFFINAFRKAIYQIPTENETDVRENSAYGLQRLFYQLQTSQSAVSTNELTLAFGWESRQIFEQQDVQEFSRILMDRMESKMKDLEIEKALPDLFVGQMKTYITCMNVDYESSRPEDFWDIQLNVRGNDTLDDSFKDYVQVETMDGDNKYFAEGFGLQDAKKGVIFEKFPQILHLQLKRFEYNFQADAMTKVYDRYEFPEVWDASPYLSEGADRSEPYIYHLHGVLVHSGDLNAGHYYAYLKPTKDGEFYKFDDDRVTPATKKEAMDENFGGDFQTMTNGTSGQRNPYTRAWSKQRFMSAYMLVYIRESRVNTVMKEIGEKDTPPHLGQKIMEEKAELERRRKEREEAHLYTSIVVGTDENFAAYQGFDLFPTSGAYSPKAAYAPKSYRLLKSTRLADFNKLVATDLNVEPHFVRVWALVNRQNLTVRPDVPMTWPTFSIEEAQQKLQSKGPLKLWAEIAKPTADGQPDWIDVQTITNLQSPTKPILLFLKHFDAEKQELRGHGHVYIAKQKKVAELGPLILERMGWPAGANLRLYEEIKSTMIEPLNTKSTFHAAELQDGDIVCFQQILPDPEFNAIAQAGNYTDPPKFYDYLQNKVTIHFGDRNALENEDAQFSLELSKKMSFDQLLAKVAEHLKADPTHIRFWTVNASNNRPRVIVRRTPNQTLSAILNTQFSGYNSGTSQRNDTLYYEVLELSLSELESKRYIKVILLSDGIAKEDVHEVLVSKAGTVADVYPALQKKAGLSDEGLQTLRFYEAHAGRIYKELTRDDKVTSFNEYVSVYAEQIPSEELEADPSVDRAVYAFHFDKEPAKTHGVPFKFVIKPGEDFKDTRERLSKRTGIKGKLLEKVKFAIVAKNSFSRPEYLQDDDILFEKLVGNEDLLGLDHGSKTRSLYARSDAMSIR